MDYSYYYTSITRKPAGMLCPRGRHSDGGVLCWNREVPANERGHGGAARAAQ